MKTENIQPSSAFARGLADKTFDRQCRSKGMRIRALSVLMFLLVAVSARAAGEKVLTGHVPPVISHLAAIGSPAPASRLNLAIGLPLRNREALAALLEQLYDPASTNFHRFLTLEQFTQQFGPTESEYQSVLNFIATNGLTVLGTYPHRELVDVSGSVADIEKAFHTTLRIYRHPTERRDFYAPEVEPSINPSIPIGSISGLEDYYRPIPGALRQAGGPRAPGNGSGPGGTSYRGKDFRIAYVPNVTLNGAGQYVGLIEFDGYFQSDITSYETQAGLPNVPLTIIPLAGSAGFPDNNTNYVLEVSLDMEMAISMAPGLSGLYVFEGNNFNSELGSMVTNTQIKQFSSSWFGFSFNSTGDGFLQQLAAQGQTFFQASGDGDSYTQIITGPADEPWMTVVGGTSLTMDAIGSNYVSETVWNAGFQVPGWNLNGAYTNGTKVGGYWGSGGGVSSTYSIPTWQQGVNLTAVGGSTSKRNIPDVALTASNVWVTYFNGLSSGTVGGTSCAAPLWAGFAALVNQQCATAGKPSIGFLNPALYAIGESGSGCFHDITTGNDAWPGNTGSYSAAVGYDLCTGWGTPTPNLINALADFSGTVWVDFTVPGPGNGAYTNPYNTLALGTANVAVNGTVAMKGPNSTSVNPTFVKPLTLNAYNGSVTIGH